MKKNYFLTLTLLGMSAIGAGAVDVPYASYITDPSTKVLATDWVLENANGDPNTWVADNDDNNITKPSGCPCGVKYQYNQNLAADDWLFSPEFSLSAGTEYKISFWLKETSANKEKFEVYVGSTAVAADYANVDPVKVYDKNIGTTWRHETVSFTPDASGDFHVGLRVCSDANQYTLLLRGFDIKDNKKYPAAPANLMVIPAPDKTLKATVSWTLPVVDDEGDPLTSNLTGINVKRNGVAIASLAGDATEYLDETIPEPGIYEYEVSALLGDAEGVASKVTSTWIGILTAQTLPYSTNFKDTDHFSTFWTILDLNADAKTNSNTSYPPLSNSWCLMANAMKNAYWPVIYSSRNSNITDDDWLISAPLAFPAKGKYKVSFRLSIYGSNVATDYALSVFAGKSDTADGMDIEIGEINKVEKNAMNPNTDGVLCEYEFEVPGPGAYYIGFHSATRASSLEHQLRIGDFNVDIVELDGDQALVPPYRSESDLNWTDRDELTFISMPGYYHASWQTEGEVSVDGFELDNEFSDDFAVLKVLEESNIVFSSTLPFTSFEILPADHTPSSAEECNYIVTNNGELEFSVKIPVLNVSGSALYEVEGVKIFSNETLIAEKSDVAPGEIAKVTVETDAPVLTRSEEEPVFTVVLHNLSGESQPAVAQRSTPSGIENISSDNADTKRFSLEGIEIKTGSAPAGAYIELRNGKARKVIVK